MNKTRGVLGEYQQNIKEKFFEFHTPRAPPEEFFMNKSRSQRSFS
jgi:hypothetical protein